VVTRLDDPARGAKLLVLDPDGAEGTLGDPGLDGRVTAEERRLMAAGRSQTLSVDGVRAFVEVFAPPSVLLVVGASHVAMPLVTLGRLLGFRTVVIDGRPRFATRERFPDADEVHVGVPSELVQERPLLPSTALVLVAHDYKYDVPVLRHALETEAGYIGLLGSTRRAKAILDLVREEGVEEAALQRVRAPIGLDLGAQSAPEIALAVMAEVLAVHRGATALPISEKVRRGIK
jgi:xanthine dehydrogenase accessory factor